MTSNHLSSVYAVLRKEASRRRYEGTDHRSLAAELTIASAGMMRSIDLHNICLVQKNIRLRTCNLYLNAFAGFVISVTDGRYEQYEHSSANHCPGGKE